MNFFRMKRQMIRRRIKSKTEKEDDIQELKLKVRLLASQNTSAPNLGGISHKSKRNGY